MDRWRARGSVVTTCPVKKWNEFKQENARVQKLENLSEDVFSLLPSMLSLDPSRRPDASAMLPILQKKLQLVCS